MFDWVNFKALCPECGTEVGGWQTKSASCSLITISPAEARNWYSSCPNCGLWIEYEAKRPQEGFFATRYTSSRYGNNQKRKRVDKEQVLITEKKPSEWSEE